MTDHYDMVITGGTVATAADTFRADVGVRNGRIAAIADDLAGPSIRTEQRVDATGRLVLPGGIDAHCHVEQESSSGMMTADDFGSGSVSAAFGGNTTFVPFAAQHRGQSLLDVVAETHDKAGPKSVIDYAFHLIVSDPTELVLDKELPELIDQGYVSFKVYLTYERLKISDRQMLDVLTLARERGAVTMVHAENDDMITWLTEWLLARGDTAPKYHAEAHHHLAESEATRRAIDLARLAEAELLIVHVSSPEAAAAISSARNRGLPIHGETCPQYLFLTADDLDRPGPEGAKYCCSPPPRDHRAQKAIWQGLVNDTFQVFSSDHSPYRFDESGKLSAGPNPPFNRVANGVPGLEVRMPLLFSAGVLGGRLTLNQFVALTSTNAAKLYGLAPRKGTVAVGADADLALWDPDDERTIRQTDLHDNMDYTPFEGMRVTGWPTTVIRRGEIIVEGGELRAEPGDGAFVERKPKTYAAAW